MNLSFIWVFQIGTLLEYLHKQTQGPALLYKRSTAAPVEKVITPELVKNAPPFIKPKG
jgi:hypothetical protein